MHEYLDAGVKNVWLKDGYVELSTAYGDAVEYEDVRGLHEQLARALLAKPSPLSAGEFGWLRKYSGLTQKRVGELLDRTEHLIGLIEGGKKPIETLVEREFRRLVAESRQMTNAVGSVRRLASFVKKDAQAFFVGTFAGGAWLFSVLSFSRKSGAVGESAELVIETTTIGVPIMVGPSLTPTKQTHVMSMKLNGEMTGYDQVIFDQQRTIASRSIDVTAAATTD